MAVPSVVGRSVGRGVAARALRVSGAGRGVSSSAPASATASAAAAPEATPAARPYEEMPGPKAVPVFGNIWRFLPVIGEWANMDILKVHTQLKAQYGNIVKLAGMVNNRDMVVVFDPADIEKVYRNEGPWPKREAFQSLNYYRTHVKTEKYKGAGGLLTTNEKEWQDFRRSVQTPMLQPRAALKYTEPIDTVAAEFLDRLREIRDENGVLPDSTTNWFFRWALESIAIIALDTRLGCLDPNRAGEPQQMIDAVQVLFDGMFELDIKPSLWRFISTPMWRRYVKTLNKIEEVSSKYIQSSIDRLKAKVDAGGDLGDDLSILERLLLSNDNPRIAVTMAQDMLIAGIDTTSYTTAALLYFLSKNPDKQELLYAELRKVLPEKDTPVTAERLAQMKYLRAAIKESMRMRPVAIGQIRENSKEGLVLGNYSIPKGVDVAMMLAITGNDPQFMPQPEQFRPERWLRGDPQASTSHPFATLPFGFGPRICIGKRLAELELEVLNAKLLRNFRVEYPGEATFETHLLQVITTPMNFRITDRD